MNRVDLAIRSFFWILFNKKFAERINEFFVEKEIEQPKAVIEEEIPIRTTGTKRNDAYQLLALLQREGRLVDFLKEPIDTYNDAQIGAAVRDLHRDCAAVLDRVFDVKPLLDQSEGAPLTLQNGYDPEMFRLTGNVTGKPPFTGVLRHHGWKATKCDLPIWKGSADAASVIASAEIEL